MSNLNYLKLDPNLPENAKCKGVALIVSNNYEGTDYSLPGTDEDSHKMKEFFSMLKNYNVVTLKNLRSEEFLSACKDLAALSYPETYKRIVIYFAGHGGDGFIVMLDKQVHIEDVQAIFDLTKHPRLCRMARIFFIDACRGNVPYTSQDTRRGSGDSGAQSTYHAHCKHENELIAYSTLKGYVAFDDEHGCGGSWTLKLHECLMESVRQDLCQVLTLVNAKLGPHQTSTYHSSLSEFIHFKKESGKCEVCT